MRIPVLTYHASHVAGDDYASNDHVALAADLAMFTGMGWRVVPLEWVVEQRLGLASRDLTRCLALTCDDGTDLDFRDVDYPGFGQQRGFLGCLSDARAAAEICQPTMHMTAFVIADPDARARMDRECLLGLGWMREEWWARAQSSGLMAIESHSWDHNHAILPTPGVDGMQRGDFLQVDSARRAASEIDTAVDYLNRLLAPQKCRFFAYPYGHGNTFLVQEYLPQRGHELGLLAAFGAQGEAVTMTSERWLLPRYVCGWHWRSPDALAGILGDCDTH